MDRPTIMTCLPVLSDCVFVARNPPKAADLLARNRTLPESDMGQLRVEERGQRPTCPPETSRYPYDRGWLARLYGIRQGRLVGRAPAAGS